MHIKLYGLFFLMLVLMFISGIARSEPIWFQGDDMALLPEKIIQMKVGVVVGNDVFSYDDFQRVDVLYPKSDASLVGRPQPPTDPVTHKVLQWFVGNLVTETIHPAPLPTKIGLFNSKQIEHAEFRLQWGDERIQRWCYKDNSFWCISERVVQFDAGVDRTYAYNELLPFLYRTVHKTTISDKETNEQQTSVPKTWTRQNEDDIERVERIPAIATMFADERFQSCSLLPPLRTPPSYDYLSGGFDFLPISRDHWQLCTLIPNWHHHLFFPFTLWEGDSRITERDNISGYENKWTVRSQSLLAWSGKFFAVPIKNAENNLPSFHIIRDSTPCSRLTAEHISNDFLKSYTVSGELYRLDVAEEDMINEDRKPWHLQMGSWKLPPSRWTAQTVHCKKPVLDPEKHRLIALIYVEPEGKVYGFGKDFYVRLDILPENGDLTSAIVPCRDITVGEVRGLDHSGKERVIGEPFRTVWECSLVLKERGLLEK